VCEKSGLVCGTQGSTLVWNTGFHPGALCAKSVPLTQKPVPLTPGSCVEFTGGVLIRTPRTRYASGVSFGAAIWNSHTGRVPNVIWNSDTGSPHAAIWSSHTGGPHAVIWNSHTGSPHAAPAYSAQSVYRVPMSGLRSRSSMSGTRARTRACDAVQGDAGDVLIDASSQRQPRSARSRSTPATGPGTRRRRGNDPRLARDGADISESPDMGRALTERVTGHGFEFCP
jgi:hypothetical protein